jgi:hypothetical protein
MHESAKCAMRTIAVCYIAKYVYISLWDKADSQTVDRVPVFEDDEIVELYEEKAGHLTENHVAFFRKWDDLLTVEEQDSGRFRSQLWTMTAAKREKSGRYV